MTAIEVMLWLIMLKYVDIFDKRAAFDIAGGNALTAGSDIFMRGLISTSLSFLPVVLCLAYNTGI